MRTPRIYTVETSPEIENGKKYISIRCPHIGIDGYICHRQLARLTCDGNLEMETKCPKCKSTILVRIIK